MIRKITLAAALFAFPLQAQQFTTAAEIRPILDATKANWVAVREYDGQDLLYFTHLMAWRCGLDSIYYSVNSGAEVLWNGEPCHDGEAQPNAIKATDSLPFTKFALQSVNTVNVRLVYDDGGEATASFARADIMTP